MIALGIDLSLTGTGLVVLDEDKLIYSECFKPKNKSGSRRLVEIRCKISKTLKEYAPALVCLEGYSFRSRGRAVFQIGELGGIVRVLLYESDLHGSDLYESGIKWLEIAPSQVKKFATGKGNSGKDLILQQVYKRWGQEFETSDEADAFVLAKIGTILLGHKEKLTVQQGEVIKAIKY